MEEVKNIMAQEGRAEVRRAVRSERRVTFCTLACGFATPFVGDFEVEGGGRLFVAA